MELYPFLEWLEATAISEQIQLSNIWFPALEAVHVIGIALVFGTIAMVDLRLIGLGSRGQAVSSVMKASLRWTWLGFALAVITGLLMFISSATTYAYNLPFQLKMALLVFAGGNMLMFESLVVRGIKDWDSAGHTPTAAKISGALSIIFWISIVAFGRWIGFTKLPF